MGNSQVTERDLAWLAGIWDGEGHISIRRTILKKSKTPQYSPRVGVTNSNKLIISTTRKMLRDLDIKYIFREKQRGGFTGSRKRTWLVSIETLEPAKRFLTYLKPYLIAKPVQAKLLLEFCDRRMKNFSREDPNSKRRYAPRDFKLVALILELNGDIRGAAKKVRRDARRASAHRRVISKPLRCENCGTRFERSDPRKRSCSDKCKKAVWRRRRLRHARS